MVFQQKPLEKADFIVKMTGPAVVRPASLTLALICMYNKLVVSLMSFPHAFYK